MGRGVSAGGGQSSLGYLFGSGEAPKPSQNNANTTTITTTTTNAAAAVNNVEVVNHTPKCRPASEPVDVSKQIPAGINSSTSSTQNTGNFLTVCSFF